MENIDLKRSWSWSNCWEDRLTCWLRRKRLLAPGKDCKPDNSQSCHIIFGIRCSFQFPRMLFGARGCSISAKFQGAVNSLLTIKKSVIYIFHSKTGTLVLHATIQQVPSSVIVDKTTYRFSYLAIYTHPSFKLKLWEKKMTLNFQK